MIHKKRQQKKIRVRTMYLRMKTSYKITNFMILLQIK